MSAVVGIDPQASAEPDELILAATFGRHVRELLLTSWLFRVGCALTGLALLLALVGPYLARYPLEEATANARLAPNADYWFGTDPSGFDVFSRVMAAPRIDVTIAVAATIFSLSVGSVVGLLTSYFRGWLGEVVMRATDMAQSFPLFVLAIVVVVLTGRNMQNIIIVVALLNVPIYVRLVRTQVLAIRERAFVEAARASGDTEVSIAFRHVLPNAMSPGLAQAPITMAFAMLVAAGLSFIGAGVRPPTPEWGAMIAAGSEGIVIGEWWTSFFPGLGISLTVFGFAIVGDGLRSIWLRQT